MRGRPARNAGTTVREVCERWGLPVAVIGRVTADGDITIVEGGLDADGRPRAGRPRARPDPGRGPDQRRDRPPAGRRAADPPPRRPGARARRRRSATGSRSAGWTRAPCSSPCSARPNLASRHAVFHQYDSTVGADTVAGPAAAPRSCGSRARRKALVATTDGNQAVGAVDPWLGAALSRRRGDAQRLDHRRAAARRHELPQLRRPDPARGVLAAQRGRPRPRPTRAGRSGCRSPAATSRSTTSRRPARSRRRRRSASSACSRTSATLVGPAFVQAARRRPARRRGRPRAWPAPPTPRSPAPTTEDDPPALDLAREAAAPGVRPRGDRAGPRRLGPGRLGRRPRRRPRRVRDVGRPRRVGRGSRSATRRRSTCSARARRASS